VSQYSIRVASSSSESLRTVVADQEVGAVSIAIGIAANPVQGLGVKV
jgi:hypothetical protein